MNRKKSSRGCLAPFLFFLLLLAALFYFGTGGGGSDGGADSGGASPASRAESFGGTVRSAERKIGDALSSAPIAKSEPIPVPPVPDDFLAAWSARFSAGPEPDSAGPVRDALRRNAETGEGSFPPEPRPNAANGIPGVILLRYNPPTPETGFSLFLGPAGRGPIPVEGRTTREFCDALSRQLDELAKLSNGEYPRFYALETDTAGPSQTRWLSETVRAKFPGIIFETKSSTKDDRDAPNQE